MRPNSKPNPAVIRDVLQHPRLAHDSYRRALRAALRLAMSTAGTRALKSVAYRPKMTLRGLPPIAT